MAALIANCGAAMNVCSPGRQQSYLLICGQACQDHLRSSLTLRVTFALAGPGGFHELERGSKQFEILLVLGRLGAVDLYPLP